MFGPDSLHAAWMRMTPRQRAALASEVGASVASLQQLVGGYKLPSMTRAADLVDRVPTLTYQSFVDSYHARIAWRMAGGNSQKGQRRAP